MAESRGKLTRQPVAVIPFPNANGAYVLCDDGSLWHLNFNESGSGKPSWNDLDAPLPGSAAAAGWKAEHAQYRAGMDVPRPSNLEPRKVDE